MFIWRTNFTELGTDTKENDEQNEMSTSRSKASKVSVTKKQQTSKKRL